MDGAHKLDSHSVFQIRRSQCFVQIFFCILFDRSGFLGLAIPMLKKKQTENCSNWLQLSAAANEHQDLEDLAHWLSFRLLPWPLPPPPDTALWSPPPWRQGAIQIQATQARQASDGWNMVEQGKDLGFVFSDDHHHVGNLSTSGSDPPTVVWQG